MNRCEQVGTGVKSFDQVSIPVLRRSDQNRCEVVNNWWGMISKSNNEERPAEHEKDTERQTTFRPPGFFRAGGGQIVVCVTVSFSCAAGLSSLLEV